jgi:hypothetical protein
MRRYPVVGGLAGLRVPLMTALLALGGLAMGTQEMAVAVLALGWVAHGLWRSVVIEVSPDGLARRLGVRGVLVGPTASLSWSSVVAVETGWREPDDYRALETAVRGRDGTTIRISTAMGCRNYWACLAEIVRRAPWAARAGLTDATLAGGPPGPRDVVEAARTAGTLALILGAMVGVCYVWAQGRSALSRDLEEAAAVMPSGREECRPGPRIEPGGSTPGCRPTSGEARAPGP